MSLWRRLARLLRPSSGHPPADHGVGEQPASSETPAVEPDSAADPQDPERVLERLATTPGLTVTRETLESCCTALEQSGREMRAIDLLRRVLAQRAAWPEARWLLARLLLKRGEDSEADEVLASLEDDRALGVEALLARAEIAERAGDDGLALTRYERVLATDLGNVRARGRAERLRRGSLEPRGVGATLLAGDGALARGRYRIVRELGRGGAGTVFAAEDTAAGRLVALKIYHSVRSRPDRERLLAEARVAASLEHPGVVRILDLDEALGAIAMEHLESGSLRLVATPPRRLGVERAPNLAVTFAEALAFVHDAGVVHRDLKPSNLLLRQDGRVVLTDFGVARRVGEQPAEAEGTLAYMAPEQRQASRVAPSADVYSMGKILLGVADCVVQPDARIVRMRGLAARMASDAPDARPQSGSEAATLLQSLGGRADAGAS